MILWRIASNVLLLKIELVDLPPFMIIFVLFVKKIMSRLLTYSYIVESHEPYGLEVVWVSKLMSCIRKIICNLLVRDLK
jgi:hypothetical protein